MTKAPGFPSIPFERIVWLATLPLVFLLCSVHAAMANPHPDIRPSLVEIVATAVLSEDSPTPGVPVRSEATGFIVSEEGLVLTAHHLLKQLGQYDPQTVKFVARLQDGSRDIEDVTVVNGLQNVDLLLLKIPRRIEPYPFARIGSFRRLEPNARIFTSGFKGQGIGYFRDEGFVNNEDGIRGNLATISMNLFGGQSGSPIYGENGMVVGIAKGTNVNDPNTNYMVPIHFANPLIGYLTMEKLESQVSTISTTLETHNPKDLEESLNELQESINLLRRHFVWEADFSEDGSEIELKYSKLIAGPPHVAKVKYKVDVTGGTFNRHAVFPGIVDQLVSVSNEDQSVGIFRLEGVGEKINALRSTVPEGRFEQIRVTFSPLLDNSEALESENIYVIDAGGPS